MLGLAARSRPKNFDDVIGQEIVKKILKNGLKSGKLSQICLFYGASGIGKTTLARLTALSLVCSNPDSHMHACLKCENCQAALHDQHPDIFEIDAATYTGIDNIKELTDNITYKPRLSKYRIYIIDEMHMLSRSATAALLKTIEEPPAHVWFFFATTEKDKIPDTIFSRCLSMQLQHVTTEALMYRMQDICKHERIQITSSALKMLAENSIGNIRLALTLLDQAHILAETDEITDAHVRQLCDIAKNEELHALYNHIRTHNVAKIFEMSETLCCNYNPVSLALQLLKLSQDKQDILLGTQIAQMLELLYKSPYPHKIMGILLAKASYLHTLPAPSALWDAIKNLSNENIQTVSINKNEIDNNAESSLKQTHNAPIQQQIEKLDKNTASTIDTSQNTKKNEKQNDLYQEALAIFGK